MEVGVAAARCREAGRGVVDEAALVDVALAFLVLGAEDDEAVGQRRDAAALGVHVGLEMESRWPATA
jgi:hypothetical protein